MNHKRITAQIESLAQELEAAKQEYDFARIRAQRHRLKALEGDQLAGWYLDGAQTRMQELQQIMNTIVESMAILEDRYNRIYFEQITEGESV